MFVLDNQFLLPADKAESGDLVGEGVSGARSFLPGCRFWHFLSTAGPLVVIRSLSGFPARQYHCHPSINLPYWPQVQ